MAGITTAYCASAKAEHYAAAHCFDTTTSGITGTTSTNFVLSSLSTTAGISVGNGVSGTGVPSGSIVASVDSSSQITISKATTASASGVALTFAGDTFKVCLIIPSSAGTYGSATTNYSQVVANSDEVPNGSGYTTTGTALTNVGPVISGTGAYINFSNPSWTSATFSARGCGIYNTIARLGDASASGTGRMVGVFDFGGTQTVSSGTFTVLMPSATLSTAVFSIA